MTPLQRRCQELLPVIQWMADGKAVEQRDRRGGPWRDTLGTCFDLETYEFRVKPEPKYRPFTPEEAVMQSGSKLLNKRHGHQAELTASSLMTVWLNQCASVTFETLLNNWTFADGTPCGVEVTE